MSNKELNPCPFCGGKAESIDLFPRFFVKCKNCGANTGIHLNIPNAIEAWNTRNYPVSDSSNSSEKPNSSIGEKIIDAIIENKLFSVINPRTNKEIKETLIVWSSMTDEILEAVIAKEFFKSRKIEE